MFFSLPTRPNIIIYLHPFPRLLLWYGADFGRDLPTRLARLLTMVPRPPTDLTGSLTGSLTGDVVAYDGYDKQYYAHACLAGNVLSYYYPHSY